MKVIVMEVREKSAAVLRNDGVFEKIEKECQVGDTLDLDLRELEKEDKKISKRTLYFPQARSLIVAAAAVIFIVSGIGYQKLSVEAYSYVTVDVNPAIEYTLNRMNQVIDVEAVNEEAGEVVTRLKESLINHKSLSANMEETEKLLKEAGYITDNEDYILMNIVSTDDAHKEKIQKEIKRFSKEPVREMDTFVITEASPEDREHAREHRMSTGRYCEIQRMDKPDFEMERGRPLEEIMRENGRLEMPDRAPDKIRQAGD